MLVYKFIHIYIYIERELHAHTHTDIYIYIYLEGNTRSTPHLCMSIYDVVSNDCKVYMMSFGVNAE